MGKENGGMTSTRLDRGRKVMTPEPVAASFQLLSHSGSAGNNEGDFEVNSFAIASWLTYWTLSGTERRQAMKGVK